MNTTPNIGAEKIDSSKNVSEDHVKLITMVELLDEKIGEILAKIAAIEADEHEHDMSAVNGLQTALEQKASSNHTHSLNDLSDVDVDAAQDGKVLTKVGTKWGLGDKGVSLAELNSQMSTKADTSHSHATSDIAGLQTALNAARDAAVAIVMGGATPAQLDTLKELAAALQDNDSEIAAIVSSLASKAPLVSPNFTGSPKIASNDIVHAGNILSLASDAAAPSYDEGAQNRTPDLRERVNFHYLVTGNITINNPTGMAGGVSGAILIFSTADRVVSWGNKWLFPDNEVPEIKTGATLISFYVENGNKVRANAVAYP